MDIDASERPQFDPISVHPMTLWNASLPSAASTAEQRARELEDFIENAAVALHLVGPGGTILWANQAELRLLGYSRDEFVGRNITEFHVDQPVILDILRRLERDEPVEQYEARLRCKNGSIRYVSISSSVYREDGRFVHTRCVTLDITGQKRAVEADERLSAIVESSDDAIVSKDLSGTILSWNRGAQRIFGYAAEEVIGKHISILAAPERIDEIPDILERIRRGERVDHYETKRRTKDGRILTVSLTVSPMRDQSGKVIGASKVARDITHRERQEQALRDANTALTRSNADLQQFAYSASHDLQEPLRMVSTYSELLRREFGGKLGPDGEEYLGYTLQGALRMEQLLKDLRAYTQASVSGEQPLEYIEATSILEKALANLETAIHESGAILTYTTLPRVQIHQFPLEQLFQNLIGNAIRYRSTGRPRIIVAATKGAREWIFSVGDNGIGIDPQYKEQIFGLFKRLHTTAEYPGTGMGLAICQRIVERLGGRIWVESQLGHGAIFYFAIPSGDE